LNGHETRHGEFWSNIIVGADFNRSIVDNRRETFKTPIEADFFAGIVPWIVEENTDFVPSVTEGEVHYFRSFAEEETELTFVNAHS